MASGLRTPSWTKLPTSMKSPRSKSIHHGQGLRHNTWIVKHAHAGRSSCGVGATDISQLKPEPKKRPGASFWHQGSSEEKAPRFLGGPFLIQTKSSTTARARFPSVRK